MSDSGEHIQAPPTATSPRAASDVPLDDPPNRGMLGGLAFGALAGIPMAALAGAAFCLLTEVSDSTWPGAIVGALVGPFGGVAIAFSERKIRGALTRPDIATIIGICFGLLLALPMTLGIGGVTGRLSGYLCIGGFFIGPAAGMLIGALLDRAHEASSRKAWGAMAGSTFGALAACVALVFLLERLSIPNTNEVAENTRKSIRHHWLRMPGVTDAQVRNVTLTHQFGKTFVGVVEGTINGAPVKTDVEVVIRQGIIHWQLAPADELKKERKE